MNPIKFEKKIVDGIYEFHFTCGYFYPNRDERVIPIDETFVRNPDLWNEYAETEKVYLSSIYLKYGISTSAHENILLIMLIVWELANKEKFLGVNSYQTSYMKEVLKKEPLDYIDWYYDLTHEEYNTGIQKSDNGFKKDKSRKVTKESQREEFGIFEINNFQELVNFSFLIFDVCSTFDYYIGGRSDEIIKILRSDSDPAKSLYEVCDIFLSFMLGHDLCYCDYYIIKSKTDISQKVEDATAKVNHFASVYVKKIKEVKTIDEMTLLIDKLLAEMNLVP